MGSTEIHTEPLRRKYKASRLSCAYCYWILASLALLLVPLFLAFASHSFWLKESSYTEQPDVAFQYKLIVLAEGTRIVKNESHAAQLFYSTNTSYNNLYQESVRIPQIRSRTEDWNRDALTDAINLNIQLPLLEKEQINQVTLLVFFQYQLKNRVRLNMESVAFVQCQSALPGRAVNVYGDLVLNQRELLQVTGGSPYTTNLLLSNPQAFEASAAKDLLFPKILAQYHERNVTTRLDNQYVIWEQALAENNQNMTLKTRIVIPDTRVVYRPDWSEMVKWAWIQYYAVFVVIYAVFQTVNDFVFKNQILETVTITEGLGVKSKKLC